MSRRRISPTEAVLSACAIVGVIAGALVWKTGGPAMSVCLMMSMLFVGAAVVRIGQWAMDQRERRARGKRAAARQRNAGPPLPRRWEVPDYPPEDLRPPAS